MLHILKMCLKLKYNPTVTRSIALLQVTNTFIVCTTKTIILLC